MKSQRAGKFEWFEYLGMGCGWAWLTGVLSVWIGIDLASGGSRFLAGVFLFLVPAMLILYSVWIWKRVQQPPIAPERSITAQIEQLSVRFDKIEGKVDELLERSPKPLAGNNGDEPLRDKDKDTQQEPR